MHALLREIRRNRLLWLLVFVPVVFAAQRARPEAQTLLFLLSVLAIVPLAALLSHATEAVATKTGDTLGGLGASFLLGGLKYHVQEFNRASARLQAGLLFVATVALLVPSAVSEADATSGASFGDGASVALSLLLVVAYGLGLLFSLKTHAEVFGSAEHAEAEAPWPLRPALVTLAGVTVLVALVSEVFVESVQGASLELGMTPAFVGFIVVALVGAAAEMASAFAGARRHGFSACWC
jgi:Ca2+:H+ antiporter